MAVPHHHPVLHVSGTCRWSAVDTLGKPIVVAFTQYAIFVNRPGENKVMGLPHGDFRGRPPSVIVQKAGNILAQQPHLPSINMAKVGTKYHDEMVVNRR